MDPTCASQPSRPELNTFGHPSFPRRCQRSDRRSAHEQGSVSLEDALRVETQLGLEVVRSGETREGALRFAAGAERHGANE